MDVDRIGKAISFLRKRAGYTQKDLADCIGISDKAVSKWERGLGLPDIGYLRKLSILLDTDTDSLLAGDVVHHDPGWQGIIALNENKYGIGARTVIYDKPLVYYLLSYFLLVGIKNITIVCTEEDRVYLENTIASGKEYGINLTYCTVGLSQLQVNGNKTTMILYGRCLLYGVDQTRFFQKAMIDKSRLTVLALPKKIMHTTTQVLMDVNKKVINSSKDDPLNTQYDYSDIPILFCPPDILPDMLHSGNIKRFLSECSKELYVEMLDRGFVEIEVDNWDNVQEASTFMRIVQNQCGMNVYCLEEVAWRRGMITAEQLRKLGLKHQGTEYGEYILSLYGRIKGREVDEVNGA